MAPGLLFLPGAYLVRIKRPGQAHLLRQLLSDDALSWLLLAATAQPASFRLFAGVLCLFAGFWAIYELGYWDNDCCAARFEETPVVSQAFQRLPWHYPLQALGFGVIFSVLGCWLTHGSLACWAAMLAAMALCFATYNRLDKQSRVFLYPALQGFRSLGLLALLPLGPVGLAAGTAQAIARWLGYCIYRLRPAPDGHWPNVPVRLFHLVLLLLFDVILLASAARHDLFSWPALALLAQTGFLARREAALAFTKASWLPRRKQEPPPG